uniref:Uncharacterized protein n=1 Tax=Arundo donax TaxID=35708 RepID=A0A0A9AW40_ARUDO
MRAKLPTKPPQGVI